jgi:hypothetical protein
VAEESLAGLPPRQSCTQTGRRHLRRDQPITGVGDLGTLFRTLLTIALGMIVGVALTKDWRGGW